MIEQTDGTKAFQNLFEKAVQNNTIKGRVFKMTKSFPKRGGTQKLDKEIKEAAKGTTTKVGGEEVGAHT